MPVSNMDQSTLQGILAAATTQTFLDTLTITHSQITTIRIVNDNQTLTRASGDYLPFPFEVTAPVSDDQTPPVLQISVDIVDQRLMEAFRSLRGQREQPKITIELVVKEHPDTVMYSGTFGFSTLQTNSATSATIRADLLPGSLNDSYPQGRLVPSNAGAAS